MHSPWLQSCSILTHAALRDNEPKVFFSVPGTLEALPTAWQSFILADFEWKLTFYVLSFRVAWACRYHFGSTKHLYLSAVFFVFFNLQVATTQQKQTRAILGNVTGDSSQANASSSQRQGVLSFVHASLFRYLSSLWILRKWLWDSVFVGLNAWHIGHVHCEHNLSSIEVHVAECSFLCGYITPCSVQAIHMCTMINMSSSIHKTVQ